MSKNPRSGEHIPRGDGYKALGLKPMTHQDAQAEAERRWGPKVRCQRTRNYSTVGFSAATAYPRKTLYLIWVDGTLRASGLSWEAAFADADKRAEFQKANAEGIARFQPWRAK